MGYFGRVDYPSNLPGLICPKCGRHDPFYAPAGHRYVLGKSPCVRCQRKANARERAIAKMEATE